MREFGRKCVSGLPGRILLMALAYYAAGRLGLLLAVPPGYATAVWPPSGIALAGMLHFGYRVWPGIWLGSFCVNLTLAGAAGDSSAQWAATGIAAVIGLGAAAQALAGSWLVRRFIGYPTALAREGEVMRFMLLAGPASCLINSTWGVGLLALKGLMPWANTPFNWLTWWVGDTIGVLIFTPLVMMFTSAPAALWRQRRTTVLVPLTVTFALAVVLFAYSRQWERERQQAAFEQRAAAISHSFAERLTGYLEVLHAVEKFYESSPAVSRDQFHTFVGGALLRLPGIRALEWIPRVAAADRLATEQAARAVFPQFQFTEQAPDGRLVRAGERAEYFPVLFLEPVGGNESAIGFDVGSEAARKAALDQARDTGRLTVTERIALVLRPARPVGVLVVLPVYERGFTAQSSPSVAARREKLRGYVLGVFAVEEMVRSSLRDLSRDGLALGLWDAQAGQVLFATQPLARPSKPQEGLSQLDGHAWTSRHEVGGRSWLLEVRATQAFLAYSRGWQSWVVLAGSLVFTSLLGILLLVATGRTVGIEEIVEQRTSALNRSNEQLAQEVAERVQMGLRLRQMNETLEQRVAERTRALKASEQAALNMMADAQAAGQAASQAEQALRAGEARLNFALQMSRTGGWDLDLVDHTAYRTLEHDRIFGYGSLLPEWTYEMFLEHVLPEDRAEVDRRFRAATAAQADWSFECRIRRADGEVRWIWATGEHQRDAAGQMRRMAGIVQDITVRKQAEEQVRASLREKEVLLQEIHHRVKNNLQVVSSLLNLQAEHIKHPETLRAFAESRARIQSMALVHKNIYHDASLARLDFSEYLRELTSQLFQGYNISPTHITLRLELAPIAFGLDTAIPCALIVNELVSNALKYAFPPGHTGEILVCLRSGDEHRVQLEVADNGVGMPSGFDWQEAHSLGLSLVRILASQLHGQLHVTTEAGVRFRLEFSSSPTELKLSPQ